MTVFIYWIPKRTYYRNDPRDQLFRNQNKYFALRILRRSRHNFVLIYFFVNKYVYCFHIMPDKRRLVTSKVCLCSEKAGLLKNSYNKWALEYFMVSCSEPILQESNTQPKCSYYRTIILTSFIINKTFICVKRFTNFRKELWFSRFRLATPAKYVVKTLLKWQFGLVVKHQSVNSEVTGSNPGGQFFFVLFYHHYFLSKAYIITFISSNSLQIYFFSF